MTDSKSKEDTTQTTTKTGKGFMQKYRNRSIVANFPLNFLSYDLGYRTIPVKRMHAHGLAVFTYEDDIETLMRILEDNTQSLRVALERLEELEKQILALFQENTEVDVLRKACEKYLSTEKRIDKLVGAVQTAKGFCKNFLQVFAFLADFIAIPVFYWPWEKSIKLNDQSSIKKYSQAKGLYETLNAAANTELAKANSILLRVVKSNTLEEIASLIRVQDTLAGQIRDISEDINVLTVKSKLDVE